MSHAPAITNHCDQTVPFERWKITEGWGGRGRVGRDLVDGGGFISRLNTQSTVDYANLFPFRRFGDVIDPTGRRRRGGPPPPPPPPPALSIGLRTDERKRKRRPERMKKKKKKKETFAYWRPIFRTFFSRSA